MILSVRRRDKKIRELSRDLKLHIDAFIKQERLDNERFITWNRRYWETLKREGQ